MKTERKELIFLRPISEDEHEILAMHPADDRIVSVYRLIGTIKLKPGIALPAGWGRLEEESNDNERNRNWIRRGSGALCTAMDGSPEESGVQGSGEGKSPVGKPCSTLGNLCRKPSKLRQKQHPRQSGIGKSVMWTRLSHLPKAVRCRQCIGRWQRKIHQIVQEPHQFSSGMMEFPWYSGQILRG